MWTCVREVIEDIVLDQDLIRVLRQRWSDVNTSGLSIDAVNIGFCRVIPVKRVVDDIEPSGSQSLIGNRDGVVLIAQRLEIERIQSVTEVVE